MARIDTLVNFLTDVASAIKNKKGDTTAIKASDFDTEIANLPSGGGKYAPSYFKGFASTTSVTDLTYETKNLDLSNLSAFPSFKGCNQLVNIDVSEWEYNSKMASSTLYEVFYNCPKLKKVDLKNFITSNVTALGTMFGACTAMQYIDLSGLTGAISDTRLLFADCRALQYCNISGLDLTNISSYTNMFQYTPTNCLIIVKDDASKQWMNTNFPTMTNVKTKDEV